MVWEISTRQNKQNIIVNDRLNFITSVINTMTKPWFYDYVIVCVSSDYKLHDYVVELDLLLLSSSHRCSHNCKHHLMVFYYYGHVDHMITYMPRHAIVNMIM
jgi:hypothetical protein